MRALYSSRLGWNRRDFLKGSVAAIAAAYGLRPDWAFADVPLQFDGSTFKLAAPEANPKSGGVLRYGITNRPPHFDVHQSGTINSLSAQAVMFDNLVRRDDPHPKAVARAQVSWDERCEEQPERQQHDT